MKNILICLIKLCYQNRLYKITVSEQSVYNMFDNFKMSLDNFNFFMKLLMLTFVLLLLFVNIVIALILLYKLRINHLDFSRQLLCKFKYFKSIDGYIMANLLLHYG